MSFRNILLSTGIVISMMTFSACSNHHGPRVKKPMNTRGKSPIYIRGAEDGCATANGDYTKDHDAFNNDMDYHEGWFAGRSYCQV